MPGCPTALGAKGRTTCDGAEPTAATPSIFDCYVAVDEGEAAMADLDLFSADAGAGFDEGWVEGSVDADVAITGGLHATVCHGIDLGVDIAATAEANAKLRLLVIGARAQVGAQARAGVRGQLTVQPNIFEEFGISGRIEAAAEASARARLEIGLEAEYVADLAADRLDGLALELFLAFLREIRVGGGVQGKVAYSAMARGWVRASGRLGDDDDAGFTIGGGYSVGFKGGYGLDYFMRLGFESPRRFFSTAVNLIVDEIVGELRRELPPGHEIGVELFRLLVPAALHAAYDVGQRSLSQGITTPEEVVRPFLLSLAEALQAYLAEKASEYGARMVADLVREAIVRGSGTDIGDAGRTEVQSAVAQLNAAISDGSFDPDDVDELLSFAFTVAGHTAPEMVARFRRPAAILWTASAVAVALRDAGDIVAGGSVSFLGVGVEARARIRDMPPVQSMPDVVVQEYLQNVADFDGSALTFDHAMDYLIEVGIGPMLATHVPELAGVLDLLHDATGISPGNIVTFGIQGALGGPVAETELYIELRDFVRRAVDEFIVAQVFTGFDELAGSNSDARLYMDEVARPSIELLVNFVFEQLDVVVAEPSVLGGLDYLNGLQAGVGALLYKIAARNVAVLEQIAADQIRSQAVVAFGGLEDALRSDEAHELAVATVAHVDTVLAHVSDYLTAVPDSSGLTEAQITAIRVFAAEMLSIAQEAFGDDVFTDSRWNRRRAAVLALLLSLDDEMDWGAEDLGAEVVDVVRSCLFIPDEEALEDLFNVTLEILVEQGGILLRRLPAPLRDLMLALTGPQFDEMAATAAEYAAVAAELLAAAEEALESVLTLIRLAGDMAEEAADEVLGRLEVAATSMVGLTTAVLRPAFIAAGRANIIAAGVALGLATDAAETIAAGFDVVFDAGAAVFNPLVERALGPVRAGEIVSDAVEALDGAFHAVELLAAGGPGALDEAALEAFVDELVGAVEGVLIQGGFVPPGLIITVPSPVGVLEALNPATVVVAIVEAILDIVDVAPLLAARLSELYHLAVAAAHDADRPGKETAVTAARAEHEGTRPGPTPDIVVFSPSALDARPDRTVVNGPLVPLTLRVDGVGSQWSRLDDARRIQISTNGRVLDISPSEWSFDAPRSELELDTMLGIDSGEIQPGLNVLEISVAHDENGRVRHTVEFMVDPEAEPTGAALRVDGDASVFDSPGSDHDTLLQEQVTLHWPGPGSLDMEGWEIRDAAGHRYHFGSVRLRAGQRLRLRTGGDPADDTATDLHWGRRRAVWNNRGDTVFVLDAVKTLRAQHFYRGRR